MVFLKGWMGLPKLRYVILWTVNTTDQKAIFARLGYQFTRKFSLYAGLNGARDANAAGLASVLARPRSRDGRRVLPAVLHQRRLGHGEVLPGLWYTPLLGNNLSALGITAKQLTASSRTGASIWWMPTTKEFGPQGAFGDWEFHDQLATRVRHLRAQPRGPLRQLGHGRDRQHDLLKLADSLNLFDTGSLAPDVTVQTVDYRMLASTRASSTAASSCRPSTTTAG